MDFKEASVQYGDLRGEVAIDGYAGPPLFEMGKLANIPAEYFPIGFYLSGGEGTFPAGTILLSVAAVEKEKYGKSVDEIIKKLKNNKIHAKAFRAQVKLEDLFKHIKRLHLTAISKAFQDIDIEYEYAEWE